MKHMVNNRMFSYPLSLNAIGAAAGLSAPISMLALRGKTIYNSAGTATVIPSGSISLSIFLNKTFTNPVPTVIFNSVMVGTGIISEASKKYSFSGGDFFNRPQFSVLISNGNAVPFYININTGSMYSGTSYYSTSDSVYNQGNVYKIGSANSSTTSIYFANGLTKDIVLHFVLISSGEATITSSALYTGNIVNYA